MQRFAHLWRQLVGLLHGRRGVVGSWLVERKYGQGREGRSVRPSAEVAGVYQAAFKLTLARVLCGSGFGEGQAESNPVPQRSPRKAAKFAKKAP